jgi:hypothetical protein
MNILYVPLDERPCNYSEPVMLSDISDEITMLVPPLCHMGKLKRPANVDALWEWLFEHTAECEYAILSIDTLVYGNIINSRTHHLSADECEKRLDRLRKLKVINPNITIYAFNLVARVANYNNAAEDPEYWDNYGAAIWKYSCFLDKKQRGILTGDETNEFTALEQEIPGDVLDDFLTRRKTDRIVNLCCLDYLKSGIIDSLVIPKDDNAEFGYAAMDHRAVAAKIFRDRLMDRVMIYPGADEVGSVLLARVFCKHFSYEPRIYTRYSSAYGSSVIPGYEDRPLSEGIKAQITSTGGICVSTPQESDFLFAVNAPGKIMLECADQFTSKDISYYTYTNLHEFIHYIDYYKKAYCRPVAIADDAYCNGADNEFMLMANKTGLLEKIIAYGGWNTSENTNGMCLSHAVIASYYERQVWAGGSKKRSENFLLRKIIEDWLYQANMRYQILERKDDFPGFNPFAVGKNEEKIVETMLTLLRQDIKSELNDNFFGRKITISNLSLPWNRIYDIDFDLSLE